MLKNRINEITAKYENVIIVLAGVDAKDMPAEKKYFPFNIDKYDEFDIEVSSREILTAMIANMDFKDDYKWMTAEEYQIFRMNLNLNSNQVCVLKNNLYNRKYPYNGTLVDVEKAYNVLYEQDDKELSEEDATLFNKVSTYYGQIDYSNQTDTYYVTYVGYEEDVHYENLYEDVKEPISFVEDYNITDETEVELTVNEKPFLDMEYNIINKGERKDIIFVVMKELAEIPNKYLERINLLKKLYGINVIFTKKTIKNHVINNEAEYVKILNEYYGYPGFRDIDCYEDIANKSKKLIGISQAQMIDDIITQSEKAMKGENFKDIFIRASTGKGKSLIFQIPSIYLAEKHGDDRPITLVVSPLKSLMKDQVSQMKKKSISNADTINGDISPREKAEIIEKVKNRDIDMLYLSPEMLQASGDISMIIGDRKIASVIIDEAHIVTSWGKSFRANYYYLGKYLDKLRSRYNFPIVAFTATAIHGGPNDTYLDIIESLKMTTPIAYFGDVKRTDIYMNVRVSKKEKGKNNLKDKDVFAMNALENALENNTKTLVYFGTVKSLTRFYKTLKANKPEVAERTGMYYASLDVFERDDVTRKFKSGEKLIVLATTAFGMGVDIPDIEQVYHYSLTGGVMNYLQEIGRAARNNDLVKKGIASLDYLTSEFNEVNSLHYLSAIKNEHILDVMEKLIKIYNDKGCDRDILVSPDDFAHIFENIKDDSDLENKVKIALLMIEDDFEIYKRIDFKVIASRPTLVHGKEAIFVTDELAKELCDSELGEFITYGYDIKDDKYSAVLNIDLSAIWEKYYDKYSFSQFKRAIYVEEERQKLKHSRIFDKLVFAVDLEITIDKEKEKTEVLSEYVRIMDAYESFITIYRRTNKYFSVEDLAKYLKKELMLVENGRARTIANALINASMALASIKGMDFLKERSSTGDITYCVKKDNVMFTEYVKREIGYMINPVYDAVVNEDDKYNQIFMHRTGEENKNKVDYKIAILGIGDAAGLIRYQVKSGENPLIYVRMNSTLPMERALKNRNYYHNEVAEDIKRRQRASKDCLKYLFSKAGNEEFGKGRERVENYTKWFWDRIEEYFMGVSLEEIMDNENNK